MRVWLAVAALAGLIGVPVGAIGAHVLRDMAEPERLAWLEVGLRYHMWHALALLGVSCLMARADGHVTLPLRACAWCFAAGIVLFSGGLYLMAFAGVRSLGPVVPTGGFFFIAGWAALLVHALRTTRR